MYTNLDNLCAREGTSIHEAIAIMDRTRIGLVMVVSAQGRLRGTITDGDVRRLLLGRVDLESTVEQILERKKGTPYERPITAPAGTGREACFHLLEEHSLHHLPIVDEDGRAVGLVTLDEFASTHNSGVEAVIMAGGKGTRLRPLTDDIPKPMLPVSDRPLLEIMIEQLKNVGIGRVHLAANHQSDKITEHFGDGSGFGIDISYVDEDRPLGTAGALGLIERPKDTLLVVNGDILTDLDFRAFMAFHREHEADLTVAVRQYDLKLPYGVVECEGAQVRGLDEKPVHQYFVNAGIYLLEPVVYDYIEPPDPLDMTDLIQRLLDSGRPVASFPVREYWLDIGEHDQYQEARARVAERDASP